MFDENGFTGQEQNDSGIYTECRIVEPQDHKKKKGGKRFLNG